MKSLNRINLAILLLALPISSNIIVPRTTALSASSSSASFTATPSIPTLSLHTTFTTPSEIQSEPPQSQITTAPSPEDLELGLQEKWHVTTYWSCVTMGTTYTHCGWHEPVLPGGTEIAAAGRVEGRRFGVLAGVIGVVGILLR